MPVDAIKQDDVQTGTRMMQILGWLVAVVPVVAGLATIDVVEADRAPQVVETDASTPSGSPAPGTGETLSPASGAADPAAQRPDPGDDHG
jgi:hypothetical protein